MNREPKGSVTTPLPTREGLGGESLNPAQWEAVRCIDAPSLVIAGAGSGKTRVLTYKIAWLMQQGMEPWTILALTFTNKAAREMRERIAKLVGEHEAAPLWMGTFHSIFSRILRIECDAIGFTPHYTIYDDKDSASLIKTIIHEMELDDKVYRPGVVAHRISEAKNELIRPSQYARDFDLMRRDQLSRMGRIHEIYSNYQARLKQADAMDFDDLLLNTYILLSEHEDIRKRYEDRFQFVLVDEYQDTNFAQHRIVWLLTEHRQRVCVVGDDAQSIYSFRGARIDNILTFQKMYRDARLFKLEQNYRSTQTIVAAANSVIKHNRRQIQKDVFSKKEVGEQIPVLEAYSDKEEAAIVARKIHELCHLEKYSYGDITILYRTNAQSRVFEQEFSFRKIPYRVFGGQSFYKRKEIKDVLAYLRLIVNPNDEEALRRIINYPARGIGKTTLDKVFLTAINLGIPPYEVVSNPSAYQLQVNSSTQSKLQAFASFIKSYSNKAEDSDASTLVESVVHDSGLYAEIYSGHESEDIERQENLKELFKSIASFVSENKEQGLRTHLADFLQSVSLLTDADMQQSDDSTSVTLMTVHSAKGLEFKVVFIVGLIDELIPGENVYDNEEIEEERRVFYVAITRAAEKLYLSWSKHRGQYKVIDGKSQFVNEKKRISRFISEIDASFLLKKEQKGPSLLFGNSKPFQIPKPSTPLIPSSTNYTRLSKVEKYTSQYTKSAPLPNKQILNEGSIILHDTFGKGVVTAIEGSGLDTKAIIKFENTGIKKLLLRFARFKVIG